MRDAASGSQHRGTRSACVGGAVKGWDLSMARRNRPPLETRVFTGMLA